MAKKKGKMLRITLVKSPIGNTRRHKDTVRTLGLKKINQSVEHTDSPELQGKLYKIAHLVKIEEV